MRLSDSVGFDSKFFGPRDFFCDSDVVYNTYTKIKLFPPVSFAEKTESHLDRYVKSI